MNILIDPLPESVMIGGAEYRIESGFRTSILFELLVRDKKIPDHLKLRQMLYLYYPEIPADEEGAVRQILWFYNCGRKGREEETRNRTAKEFRKEKALYSFEQDALLIYAAFLGQYGIDLQEIEELHWWKFQALFEGLDDGQRIRKVMRIRGMDTSGLPPGEVKRIQEWKKLYALEDEMTVDHHVKLAQRNRDLKEYVRRRLEEVKRCVRP